MAKKFRIIFDGYEDEDENFDTYEEAEAYGWECCSNAKVGAEILNLSNPGDYEYDEDNWEDPDFEVIEVDI